MLDRSDKKTGLPKADLRLRLKDISENFQFSGVEIIGVHSGVGARDWRTGAAPSFLHSQGFANWVTCHHGSSESLPLVKWSDIHRASRFEGIDHPEAAFTSDDIFYEIIRINTLLAKQVENVLLQRKAFLVLGGDHSCAMGTWSGVHNALSAKGPVGLIWIDAHEDAHVPETSPSGRLHGMPVAHLLGFGLPEFKNLARKGPALRPDKLCLIGQRSWEEGENNLLRDLGVKIFTMQDITEQGFDAVFRQALQIVDSGTAGFGISLDLDVIDPLEAPGVGSPVPEGVSSSELVVSLSKVTSSPKFLGIEIVEFNPCLDHDDQTLHIIRRIVSSLF